MSYYENRIKELEHRIEQMALANRLKAIPVESQLIDRIVELNKEKARLEAENERLRKAVKIADGAVDCVIQVHDYGFKVSTSYVESLKRNWLAAKEGKGQP